MELVESRMKQTDIGLIPEEWNVFRVSEVLQFMSTASYSRADLIEGGDINYVHYGDIHTKWKFHLNLNKSHLPYISSDKLKSYSLIQVGDLIMADASEDYNGIGKCVEIININGRRAISGLHTFLLRDKGGYFAPKFKGYLASNVLVKKQFDSLATGLKIYSLSKGVLRNVQIPLPPLPEQQAIATALSDTDSWIESLEKLLDKKHLIKQGAMQQLLSPKEGWEEKKLREVCDVRDGTHDSPEYQNKGVMFITSKNIVKGKLDTADVSFISDSDARLVNQRSRVDRGDILMSMIGTIGNATYIDYTPNFCIKNIALLKPKDISPCFLIQVIYSDQFQQYLMSKLDGGIQKFISLGVLRELNIYVPSSDEQIRIATILSDMDSELESLENKLAKAKKIKQGMMRVLLTGKVRLV